MVIILKSVFTNRPCFRCLIFYKLKRHRRIPHCVRYILWEWKMELYKTYVSDEKCRGKLIGHISNSFERLIQSFKMENEVSEKYPPKRHDSSCVAVNTIPWTLLFISLFHWSPGVPIPISTNGSLKNSVKPSPNASSHSQLSVAVLIFLVALRDLSNIVSSSVSSS